jgi:hypothetical protein
MRDDWAIYSCITRSYDGLSPDLWDFGAGVLAVLFCDGAPPASRDLEYHRLRSPPRLTQGADINRWHKCFPHLVLPEHRYSTYVDGNVRIQGDFGALLRAFTSTGCALGVFRHPRGNSLVDEAIACQNLKKFDSWDVQRIVPQLRYYRMRGIDLERTISGNYFIMRDAADPRLITAMSLWWSQLFEFTKRDQISLGFALLEAGVEWCFLDDLAVDVSITRIPHRGRVETAFRELAASMRPGKWNRRRIWQMIDAEPS